MSIGTSIAWSDATWNPIIGCTHAAYQPETGHKVAHPGCDHCYAETMLSRPLPGFETHNQTSRNGKWTGQTAFIPARLLEPFTGSLKPRRNGQLRRVFLTSLSDLWHPSFDDQTRMAIHGAMLLSPWNIYQDLTKRPEVAAEWLRNHRPLECAQVFETLASRVYKTGVSTPMQPVLNNMRLRWRDFPHIHRYTSVSDQVTADALIPHLLRIPAAVRGISAEPLLGPIDLVDWLRPICPECEGTGKSNDDWCQTCADQKAPHGLMESLLDHVIVGGESGPKSRPCHLEWIDSIVKQCQTAQCPVFVKQLGKRAIYNGKLYPTLCAKGSDPGEWPPLLRVQQNAGDAT